MGCAESRNTAYVWSRVLPSEVPPTAPPGDTLPLGWPAARADVVAAALMASLASHHLTWRAPTVTISLPSGEKHRPRTGCSSLPRAMRLADVTSQTLSSLSA